MKLLALVLSSALISTATFASDTFNFDYIGAGYAKFKLTDEDGDGSLNGFTVEASKQLNENWVVSSQYITTSRDDIYSSSDYDSAINVSLSEEMDLTQWQLSAAYLIPLEQDTLLEFVSSIGRMTYDYTYEYSETFVDNNISDRQASYYGELRHFVDKDKDHTNTFGLEANYHIALLENLKASAGLGYQHISDADDKHELVYQLELAYDITNDFTISAAYRNVDVFENYFVTVRYNF
ncbi:outer membrane beta-barrel protein [Pseudoalteromonas luteoviolacea]|uniref:outer membrane beta-barrel protein n=1 Tax=Pseudoalteromonas luteoviolacea TaxID=43657 RepID=UPI001F1D9ECC|nr:outer membrane beta-barrel protein [Pseudoalteromonas luteoviolacea]MCF6439275.1 outer membrane beta-barrel protein [Pseudoalteromonas luteoviolacea]